MKKVAVIGYGYVGKAVVNLFKDHYQVLPVNPTFTGDMADFYSGGILNFEQQKALANEAELAVICVPTPMSDTGECDTSIVESTLQWLAVELILIKSTVPPGTCKRIQQKYPHKRIVFSPEYIGEGKYEVQYWKSSFGRNYPHPTDMKKHDFQIFGGNPSDTSEMVDFFKKILGPAVKYIQTDWNTAELVKYMENSWGATKVTFANEFFEIANVFGVDYNELRELLLLDGRVEPMHTLVFPDNRGFGGKCFPKDVNAIFQASKNAGYTPELIGEVLRTNKKFRKEDKQV